MEKTTKEQLTVELALERKQKVDLQSEDIDKRRALSWMLGAPHKSNGYSNFNNESERITYSWPQIYFEVGKLTAASTFMDHDGNISELEVAVEQMKQNWDKYFQEKNK